MLTRAQLDHLCLLTALELSDAEKDLLLPQLSSILDFVGQLEQCILDVEEGEIQGVISTPTPLPKVGNRRTEFLANIRHAIVNHMPELKTGLVK